jgi:hypothetical protein
MSDLRDFNPSNDSPRFADESVSLTQPIRDDVVFVDEGGLGDFHTDSGIEETGNSRSKLLAGIAVAVLVGIGGAYGVSQYMASQPVVADNSLPTPSAPTKTAAMTPPPAAPAPEVAATPTPEATAPAAPDIAKPEHMSKQAAMPKVAPMAKTHSSSSTSTAANTPAPMPVEQPTAVTPAPVQNQAANTVPDAVSPTPPANSVAGNPALNQQSADPVAPAPVDATPAPQATPVPQATQAPADTTAAPATVAPTETAPATTAQ